MPRHRKIYRSEVLQTLKTTFMYDWKLLLSIAALGWWTKKYLEWVAINVCCVLSWGEEVYIERFQIIRKADNIFSSYILMAGMNESGGDGDWDTEPELSKVELKSKAWVTSSTLRREVMAIMPPAEKRWEMIEKVRS